MNNGNTYAGLNSVIIKPIIIITIISFGFHLYRYELIITRGLMSTFALFLFATFNSFMLSQFIKFSKSRPFINSYDKKTSFYYWWLRIYGLMLLMEILVWVTMGK